MRGSQASTYPWGEDFGPTRANTYLTRIRRTTPVGVFPDGDSASGVADGAGNVEEWTSSLWEPQGDVNDAPPAFGYPYAPDDGRENVDAPPSMGRVVRGGAWSSGHLVARAVCRNGLRPNYRYLDQGFRLVTSAPSSPAPPAGGTA